MLNKYDVHKYLSQKNMNECVAENFKIQPGDEVFVKLKREKNVTEFFGLCIAFKNRKNKGQGLIMNKSLTILTHKEDEDKRFEITLSPFLNVFSSKIKESKRTKIRKANLRIYRNYYGKQSRIN